MADSAPDAPLRRDVVGPVVAATDQVEERRGELERPGFPTLTKERGDERRLGLGRRLLLVLPVVPGLELPAEAPEDEARDGERRQDAEREQDQRRPPGMPDRVVDALLVALVRCRVVELLGDDLLKPGPVGDAHPTGRGEGAAREQRAELDELVCRDVERPQVRARPVERHVTAHPDRVTPGPDDVSGAGRRRREPAERGIPLIAPHLEVHVDDVVVGHREAPASGSGSRTSARRRWR